MKYFGLFNLSDKTQQVMLIVLVVSLIIGLGYALYMLFGRVTENFQTTLPLTVLQTSLDKTYNITNLSFTDSNNLFWTNYHFSPSTNANEKYLLTSAKSSIFANPIPFFNSPNFIKCIPYFSVFDIARVIPWQAGNKDPKIISTNNPYSSLTDILKGTGFKGFTAFRPTPVVSTDATVNYVTMGDLLVQIYAVDKASGLLSSNNSTVAATVGYNGYVRFNTDYLGPESTQFTENSTNNVFWNDDGTTGGNNCLAASKTGNKWGNSMLAKWGGNFSFLKQSAAITIGSTSITGDARNTVYDTLNEAKFSLLANIGFNKMTDVITLPSLSNAPEKCETYITINNNYFKVDSQNKNAITLESNIALASKFYINFETRPTVDTTSNINILYSSEPGSYKYDYVIGFDAINSDSKLSGQLEYATLKAYPIGTTNNTTVPLTHGTTANLAIIPDATKTAMNKAGLYHNLGRAFCTFTLVYNDTRENMALTIPSFITGKDSRLTRIIAPYPTDSNSLSNKTLCITSDTSLTYPISLKAPTYPTNLKESDIVSELQSLYITSGGKPTPLTINIAPSTALVPDLKPVIMFLHNEIISITGKSGLRAFKIYPPNAETPYINIRADGSINLDKDPSYYIASYDNTLKGVKLQSRYGRNTNGCVGLEDYTSDIWFSPYIDTKPTMISGYNKLYNESVVYRLAFAPTPELIPNVNDKDKLEYGYLNADQPPKILFKKEIGQEPTRPEESPRIFITYVNDDPKLALNDVLLSAGIQLDAKTPSKLTPMKLKWLNTVVEETVFESIPLDVSNETLDARNTADNTGSVRQYFQNMVRYRLKPGTIPETFTVEAYMINGEYIPIKNIVIKAFIPAPSTTAAVAAESTVGQTAAQSNTVQPPATVVAAQPTAKASNVIPQPTTAPPTSTQAPEPTYRAGVVDIPLGGSSNGS